MPHIDRLNENEKGRYRAGSLAGAAVEVADSYMAA